MTATENTTRTLGRVVPSPQPSVTGEAPPLDREIVAAIAASDMSGVAAAFDRYAQELYVYSRSRLAVPAEAAGVVQDTFLVAWSEVSRLRQPGRLRP